MPTSSMMTNMMLGILVVTCAASGIRPSAR
jgi:hypothetical protein